MKIKKLKNIKKGTIKINPRFKKAINKNYSEKRIEEQHRITELKLLQDKKSLEKIMNY